MSNDSFTKIRVVESSTDSIAELQVRRSRRRRQRSLLLTFGGVAALAVLSALAWYLLNRADQANIVTAAAAIPSEESPEPQDPDPVVDASTEDQEAEEAEDQLPNSPFLARADEATGSVPDWWPESLGSGGGQAPGTTSTSSAQSSGGGSAPATSTRATSTTAPSKQPASSDTSSSNAPSTGAASDPTTSTTGDANGLNGEPTDIAVQVVDSGGSSVGSMQILINPANPAPPNASKQTRSTDDFGYLETTVAAGCYTLQIDRDRSPLFTGASKIRRCFKNIDERHLVTITIEIGSPPDPPSSCYVPLGRKDRIEVRITENDGDWALRYIVTNKSGSTAVIGSWPPPVSETDTERVYSVSGNFKFSKQMFVAAENRYGTSAKTLCTRS